MPNGAASAAARSVPELAGRNLELSFWVTLDSEGRYVTAANAPANQTRITSQRNLTEVRPIALKTVSTCTRRPYAMWVNSRIYGSAVSQVARAGRSRLATRDQAWRLAAGPAGPGKPGPLPSARDTSEERYKKVTYGVTGHTGEPICPILEAIRR